jgi:hypothetical protein
MNIFRGFCIPVCRFAGPVQAVFRFQMEKLMSQLLPHKLKRPICPVYIYADRNAQLIRFNDMLLPDHPCSLMFNFLEKKIGSKFVEVAEMGRLDQSSLSKVSRLHQVLCNIIYICM